jgi:Dolichyl-phosphate-mannose-protein mannosyltransferase
MARPKVRNAKSRGVTKKPPAPAARPSRTHTQFVILVLLYLFAAGVHVAALWEAARFPHLSTDEAQYTMVGENLRLGKGFTIRGQMHSGMPPIYPLFVAAAHSLGGASRHSVLCFNCFAICLVIFPAFLIARQFRLSPLNSYLIATAAAFLPHTFYAAMYMAESLQYPLVLTAFYITAKWLDQPYFRRDVWLGILLGAGLLNKFAELSFIIALLLTLLILSRRSRQQDQPRRATHALIAFGIVIALELAWITWKRVNGAGALGTYGTALEESAHAMAPIKLLLAYIGDFFLAAGLIVAVPLFYWFRENLKTQRSLAVLLATTLFCQLGIHGFLEACLTGMIRERLFLYSFPLIAIAAVAGMERFKQQQQSNIWVRYLVPYAPVLFVALISLYNYPLPSPAVEAPWAGLLGSINRSGVVAFDYSRFLLDALWAVLIAATLLVILPRRRSATVLAGFVVLFHVTTFLFTARLLTAWSRGGVGALQPVVNWLASSGVKPGDPLFISGGSWAFEGPGAVTPTDEFFQSWIHKEGPYGTLSVQLEALARYDVRMISGLAQIPSHMKPGQALMIDTRVSDMDFVSEFYPYYLYRQPLQPAGPPRALYTIDIPPGAFQTLAGKRRGDGAIVGMSTGDTGVLAISDAMAFVPGRYRLTPHLKTKSAERVLLAANLHQTNRVMAHFEVPALDPLEFDIASEDLLNFSVYGKSTPDFVFEGLMVQLVSGRRPVPVQALSQPTQQFAEGPSSLPATHPLSLSVLCSIDNINNEGFAPTDRVSKADGLHLFGWAFDSRTHFAAGPLLVEIVSDNNHAYYATAERNSRPDVASAFHIPEFAQSGFRLHADLRTVPAGWYRVYLIQTENGQPHECEFYRNVIVEE